MTTGKQSKLATFIASFRKDGTLQPGRLLSKDVTFLLIRYTSDWKPFNAVVISSIIFMFSTSMFPALTFANDLYIRTDAHWGPIEIIFSTGMCGTIFSLFSIQPLTVLGVTGPFSILAENIYKLTSSTFNDVEFLPFMAWTLIHTGWMLILLAVFNAYEWTMVYVTDFTCEIFGLLTATFYFVKAVQELQRSQQDLTFAAFLWSLVACVGTFLMALLLTSAPSWPPIFGRSVRINLQRYAVLLSFATFLGASYLPGIANLDTSPIYVSDKVFRPSLPSRTTFFVQFWETPVMYIFGSAAPAVIIAMLLFFDHNISSIMCTARHFHVKKPNGLAQPIVLLGLTTALCGLLGIPPANGLLPQAPLHSESLMHETREPLPNGNPDDTNEPVVHHTVHEQRYSNLISSGIIFIFIAPPFQKVLSFTPTAVLAGIFLLHAYQTLLSNPILPRLGYLITPKSYLPPLPPGVPGWRGVHAFTLTQLVITYSIFGITQSPAGPAFPILVFLLVPLRLKIMPRFWKREVLRFVDRWSCVDGSPEDDDPKPPKGGELKEDSGQVIDHYTHRDSHQPSETKEKLKRVSRGAISKFHRTHSNFSPRSSSIYPDGDDTSMNVLLSSENLHPHALQPSDPRVYKARQWLENQNQNDCPYHSSHRFLKPPSTRRSKHISLPTLALPELEEGLRQRQTPGGPKSPGVSVAWDGKHDFSKFGATIQRTGPKTPMSPPHFDRDEHEGYNNDDDKENFRKAAVESDEGDVELVEMAEVPEQDGCPHCLKVKGR